MRARILAALSILAILAPSLARAANYDDMIAAAKTDPASVDYSALRAAYAASPNYDPDNAATRDSFAQMWTAYNAADCATALAKSEDVLKTNFTYMAAHAVRSDCLRKLGKPDDAAREVAIGRGIANSILASGDGRSTASAFVVNTLDEQHFVLAHLGITQKRQGLMAIGGHVYNGIQGMNPRGGFVMIFFRVDSMVAGEARRQGR